MAELSGKSMVPGALPMAALTLQMPAPEPPAGSRGSAAARVSSKFDQASVDRGKEVFGPNCGKILWHAGLTAGVSNAPETYMLDGRQYLVVGAGDSLYAFCLQ
jgi:glucose dehydrogenase